MKLFRNGSYRRGHTTLKGWCCSSYSFLQALPLLLILVRSKIGCSQIKYSFKRHPCTSVGTYTGFVLWAYLLVVMLRRILVRMLVVWRVVRESVAGLRGALRRLRGRHRLHCRLQYHCVSTTTHQTTLFPFEKVDIITHRGRFIGSTAPVSRVNLVVKLNKFSLFFTTIIFSTLTTRALHTARDHDGYKTNETSRHTLLRK